MKLTLTREDMNKLGQDEKAAIIDALVVAVLADGVASPVEVARFDAEVAEVPWELDQHTVVGLIRSARERVGALKGDEGIALVKSIAEKLPSEEIREKVLRMMISVMLADGRPAKQEQQVGGVFAAAFQLSPESLRRIGADARNEAPAAPPAAAPAATAPATAPGYRWETEKTANVMFEVPTDWSRAARDNVLVVKSDKHGSGIELVAITGGPLEADTDQKIIMAELGKVLADPRITRAPKRLEQNVCIDHIATVQPVVRRISATRRPTGCKRRQSIVWSC